jgi:NADH-quinone oxidoreductase subunit G
MKSIKQNLQSLAGNEIAAIIGDLVDAESIKVLKDIMSALKSPHMDCMQEGAKVDYTNRAIYLFNTTIAGIEQSDCCILIGANPRHEATLINARIRKRSLRGNYPIYSIGDCGDLTYPVSHLGDDANILKEIIAGKHSLSKDLKQAKKPMLIIGYGALMRDDYQEILHLCSEIVKKYNFVQDGWNGFNILHSAASRVAALDLGFVPQKNGMCTQEILNAAAKNKIKAVYLLGADEIDVKKLNDTFVIYQGHHGDKSAHIADVILPGAAYTEKDATYINLEGRVQRTYMAVSPCGEAKEDWLILQMVADSLKIELKYNTKEELYKNMIKAASVFSTYDKITQEKWFGCGVKGELNKKPIKIREINYYFTDPICRASKTMAQCVEEIWNRNKVA